ncbi:MAG: carboxymuconolactone decarboxylase family protein [Deltaproteobacteria bacterium]|nr:carboxymuconolactone decarboxylase family protein [Deltaproteobacteria bacterium]
MDKTVEEKTKKTASLYFEGWKEERPYSLWQSFDKDLARDFSLFITGKLYSRELLAHPVRQLCTIAALTALERTDELKLHIHAGLNVGCPPEEITEAIFQMATYAGMPAVNSALKAYREVLQARNMWPLKSNR